jgi:hypothetical protein
MQGERNIAVPITFGPYPSKPIGTGASIAVSGVVVQVFPGSGSIFSPGSIIYTATTGVDGRATINFNQDSVPTVGWVAVVTYPAGAYDPSRPTFSLTFLQELRL